MNTFHNRLGLSSARRMAAALALTLAGGMTVAEAAGPGGPMGPGPGGMIGAEVMAPGRHLDRLLDLVSATDAQRTQIKQIRDSAAADLKPLHESMKALREQSQQLFVQPAVDAAAAESLRQQTMAVHEQVSKRMLQAMLETSGVLTVEQRKLIADKMAEMQARRPRHQRP